MAMITNDFATLSQQSQCIMLHIHHYSIHILYKPGPELYIPDWLSCHNHIANKEQEIAVMSVIIHTIISQVEVLIHISIEDIKVATREDAGLQMLKQYINGGWQHVREAVEPGVTKYWPMRYELAMIDVLAPKGKYTFMPSLLSKQILEQLNSNHMGIQKTCQPMTESVYLTHMNTNTKQTMKQCPTCLDY